MVGAVRQSAKALSNLLVSFVTSHCYPQLQLLKAKLLKGSQAIAPSEQSSQSWSRAVEAEAEAVAADWVCLLWLLQKAPADVAQGLRAEWQQGQAQEFATWVRPASELNAVRSKAAAKVFILTSRLCFVGKCVAFHISRSSLRAKDSQTLFSPMLSCNCCVNPASCYGVQGTTTRLRWQ